MGGGSVLADADAFASVLAELERDAEPAAGDAFVRLIAGYLERNGRAEGPVSSAERPADVAARFDEPVPETGRPLDEVLERVAREILPGVNRLSHPMCVGHQVSAPLPVAIWAEALKAATNNSAAVREMSPVGTMIEAQVIRWCCDLAGFGAGSGGAFTSGGTEATFSALLAARADALPHAWQDGVGAAPPVVVCGEHAHYAVTRAVAQLGLGMRNAIAIPSRAHRMDVAALTQQLDELARAGTQVMAVVATAGSTATGSFDDLEAIGTLCEERGIWLHVDGAHGASALLSGRHRHRVDGLHRARSIAWDPHKMMLMPLGTGMLLVRDERQLDAAFAQRAPYLFHGGSGRGWDQGVRSFQCSRPVDALKVWIALQRYGMKSIGSLYDHLCNVTHHLWGRIRHRPDFEALHEPECNILCFRYVAPDLDDTALDTLNHDLRERYNASGQGWITTTVLDGRRVLRVTIMNPRTATEHVEAMLDGLAACVRELEAARP